MDRQEHTKGPWTWGDGWGTIDRAGTVYSNDGENPEISEYVDLGLYDADNRAILPIRIDHYEMIYDGDPIAPANRALIAAAPELLAACLTAKGTIEGQAALAAYKAGLGASEWEGFLSGAERATLRILNETVAKAVPKEVQ